MSLSRDNLLVKAVVFLFSKSFENLKNQLRVHVLLFVAIFLIAEAASNSAYGQCGNDNAFYVDLTPAGPGTAQTTNCIFGGEYATVNVIAGSAYTFSTCGSSFDTQITLYSSLGVFIAYNDDNFGQCGGLQSYIAWTATFTGTVLVMIDQYYCTVGFTCATLSVTEVGIAPPGPENDLCGGATPVVCGQVYTGNTSSATPDAVPACGFYASTSNSVWYQLSGDGSNITASLCGSGFDTYLSAFSGTCGALTCISTSDDFCGSASQITLSTVVGVNYYFLVHGFFNASGPYTLTISCLIPTPPCFFSDPTGCPDIDLGADIAIPSCLSPCTSISLAANVFETGATTNYQVCQIPYNPIYPYTSGTGFSIGVDDVWTPIINLPFNFCFYGVTYNQCVVGSNGLLSFNTTYAAGYCPWSFNAFCPSPALPMNSIFGVYHDIDPSVCGDARYAVMGTAPCRVFVVNFDGICQFSCNGLVSSHQIVLYETTNVIEVYVEAKPTCLGWNSGNALIGIQNASATAGMAAANRQTGSWSAVNEAWRFLPIGAANYVINWYQQGSFLGSGNPISICPTQPSQTYVAEAIYTNCDGSSVTVTDDIVVACAAIFLPVQWLDFQATLSSDENSVLCTWQTGTEMDNDYFTLERSSDNEHWESITVIDGAGNSLTPLSYNWTDRFPLQGTSYYRVRQTDYNGRSGISPIRVIVRKKDDNFSIFPNPSNGYFSLVPFDSSIKISVIDARGRMIGASIDQTGAIDLLAAANGYYVLVVHNSSGEILQRIPLIVQEK